MTRIYSRTNKKKKFVHTHRREEEYERGISVKKKKKKKERKKEKKVKKRGGNIKKSVESCPRGHVTGHVTVWQAIPVKDKGR